MGTGNGAATMYYFLLLLLETLIMPVFCRAQISYWMIHYQVKLTKAYWILSKILLFKGMKSIALKFLDNNMIMSVGCYLLRCVGWQPGPWYDASSVPKWQLFVWNCMYVWRGSRSARWLHFVNEWQVSAFPMLGCHGILVKWTITNTSKGGRLKNSGS